MSLEYLSGSLLPTVGDLLPFLSLVTALSSVIIQTQSIQQLEMILLKIWAVKICWSSGRDLPWQMIHMGYGFLHCGQHTATVTACDCVNLHHQNFRKSLFAFQVGFWAGTRACRTRILRFVWSETCINWWKHPEAQQDILLISISNLQEVNLKCQCLTSDSFCFDTRAVEKSVLVAVSKCHKVLGTLAFWKIPNFVRFKIKLQELVMLQLFLK